MGLEKIIIDFELIFSLNYKVMENNQSKSTIANQAAQFSEAVFNSSTFRNLFTGDFVKDEKIYDLVGGAVMHYMNATKKIDVCQVEEILQTVKNSGVLDQLKFHILPSDEMNLFGRFFAPKLLSQIEEESEDMVAGCVNFLANLPHDYLLTNSFNGYNLSQVKANGLDCSHDDPFEKDYENLKFLGFKKYSSNGIYFTDASKVTMHFCHSSPERLFMALYVDPRKFPRENNEDLKHYIQRKFERKIQNTPGQQITDQINQSVANLVNAYGNETAGIAFITYQDFLELSQQPVPQFNTPEQRQFYYDSIIDELKHKGDEQTDREVLNNYLTQKIVRTEICKGGIGLCLENGKISPDQIAVAQVPQCGLLSLQQQRNLTQMQDNILIR